MKNWFSIRAMADGAEISIYDEIGAYGVSAKEFIAALAIIPEEQPVTLRLNSPGGSVFDAVAMVNALDRRVGDVTVHVDGVAASAASYVAMAGDTVVMPENAFMMIHDPSGVVMGTAAEMRSMAETLDKLKGTLVAGYRRKSGRDDAEIAALMANETWLSAADAIALGFADVLAEPVRVAASFDVARFRNAPSVLVDAMTQPEPDRSQTGAELEPEPEPEPEVERPSPEQIRAEAAAHACAVVDLCVLADRADMASGFLARGATIETVRADLIAARAEAVRDEIDPRHILSGSTSGLRPWAEITARNLNRKG